MSLRNFLFKLTGALLIAIFARVSFAIDKPPIYFKVTADKTGTWAQQKTQAKDLCQKWSKGHKCYFRHYAAQSQGSGSVDAECAERKMKDSEFELSEDGRKCGKWAEGVDSDTFSSYCLCSDRKPSTGLFKELTPLEIPFGQSVDQSLKKIEKSSPAQIVQ